MKTYEHPEIESIPLEKAMHALSDSSRMVIMRALLAHGELACNELPVEIAKATLSHHMGVLREAGLIVTRVEGTKCLNAVRKEAFDLQFPGLLELIRTCV
ncbi:helix-turn-helix domain-containing protein [Kiritimatiellaeota bacterium B1221]|nr:helix-turn-helix domain-containing protein [Kiritimatiellaeota bacterium B1221]